ncbi:transcriptional regulator, GntR family [Longilinea arvoryzae]|uniref:Transcriptional regulator, GntR family n=1 Tax=Longilinea arvoryzae TaxID=360412 RepID=A0A0S7BK51_9CHLR|nr:GntR family transcriptional regulator [Longilinea arvoryzae]GAP14181.1 transcriptional regulator, GntR family [Longilinea arvoryzae]
MKKVQPQSEGEPQRLFQRLQNELAQLIAETPAGERLPSEPELARKLGVSRATLREAMRAFEGQGLIRRRQGVGTFVVGQTNVIETGLELLESIETMAERIQLKVSMGDLQIGHLKADESRSTILQVPSDSPLVQISRVIHAENRPVAYLVDLLPEEFLSSKDLEVGFTGSVLDQLLRRQDIQLSESVTNIRAVAASPEIAHALQIQRGDVLLLFIAELYSKEGRMVDYSHSYFLPGYFRFHVVRSIGLSKVASWMPIEPERR